MKKYKYRVSVTLTIEQLIDDLVECYKLGVSDVLTDLWDDETSRNQTLALITHLTNVRNWNPTEISDAWCCMYSEKFFRDNPNVEEVLLLAKPCEDGTILKEWLASHPVK